MGTTTFPDPIRSRRDVDALLACTTNYEEKLPPDGSKRTFDLRRVERLLAFAGDPQHGPRTTHVAGSKGKGSVARMIAHGLRAHRAERGPVGLYTSPHLEDLAERIEVDGVPATEKQLAAAAAHVAPYLHEALGSPNAPTFFEILTTMAWLVFRAAGCEDVVLETGLGGRLDATNCCDPAVTVITSIEREHTRLLGQTIEAIAGEKAGILKPRVPAVVTAAEPALAVVRERAAAMRAPIEILGEDFRIHDARAEPGPRLSFELEVGDERIGVALPLAGVHHAENAAAALVALHRLGSTDPTHALAGVRLPGILEPVGREPLVLIDGAHTPRSAEATAAAVDACWPAPKRVLLIGMLAEKDVAGVGSRLARDAAHVVTTQVASPRAVPAGALADALRDACAPAPVEAEPDVEQALDRARALAGTDGLVLVAGSVYLAGTVKTSMRR